MTPSSDSSRRLREGTTIGNTYEVCEEIGRGGMGVVYEVRHKRLPKRFAIKVIGSDASEESLHRFRREAEIVSSLGHANILRIIDFNVLPDNTPYMVMEFLEGEDLERGLAKGRLTLSQGLSIASQIGAALQAAHDHGIVHRDLKPANVFLSDRETKGKHSYHVTVLDFGVSKVLNSTTFATHGDFVVGTPQYMAPEQASGDTESISAKSDQFSMACVVYEMMCGQKAFEGDRLAEVVFQVCHQDPPSLVQRNPEIPIAISRAVERGMSKEHSDRFASVLDFVEALHEQEIDEPKEGLPLMSADFKRAPLDALSDTVIGRRASAENKTLVGSSKQEGENQGAKRKSKIVLGIAALLLLAGLIAVFGTRCRGATTNNSQEISLAVRGEPSERKDGVVLGVTDSGVPLGASIARDGATSSIADAGTIKIDASLDAMRVATVNRAKGTRPASDKLVEAKRMLKDGEYARARQLAKKVLRTKNAGDGFVITVKSFCGEGKQGTAQDWLSRVPRAKRKSVVSYCSKIHQVDLVNF